MIMAIFSIIGLLGAYLLQVKETKYLGHIGLILFSTFWLITFAFSFFESFTLPLLSDKNPEFVLGILTLFSNEPSTVDLGVFPLLANISGIIYILGGLSFGFALFKAKVFHPSVGLLLALASLLTILAGILGHPLDRILAIPMGLALIWMGIFSYQRQ